MSPFSRDPGRPLTPGERGLAADAFGAALDPAPVRLHHARWWPMQPRGIAMAPDGGVWFTPGDGLWHDDFAAAPLRLQALLVHELTHCWQVQRGGPLYLLLMRHPFCRYCYRLAQGRPFGRYGIEQQAEIVADAFLARHGVRRAGGPTLAEYEGVLPFG